MRKLHKKAKRKRHKLSSTAVLRRNMRKVGRNEKCPCDSGKKFKYCCLAALEGREEETSEEGVSGSDTEESV